MTGADTAYARLLGGEKLASICMTKLADAGFPSMTGILAAGEFGTIEEMVWPVLNIGGKLFPNWLVAS